MFVCDAKSTAKSQMWDRSILGCLELETMTAGKLKPGVVCVLMMQEVCTDLLAPAPPTVQQASMAVNNVGSMAAAAQAVAISQRLQVREDIVRGVWVDGLSEHVVTTGTLALWGCSYVTMCMHIV